MSWCYTTIRKHRLLSPHSPMPCPYQSNFQQCQTFFWCTSCHIFLNTCQTAIVINEYLYMSICVSYCILNYPPLPRYSCLSCMLHKSTYYSSIFFNKVQGTGILELFPWHCYYHFSGIIENDLPLKITILPVFSATFFKTLSFFITLYIILLSVTV